MVHCADKLAEAKRAEREARLQHQRSHQAVKGKKEEGRLAEAAAARVERAFNSKEVCTVWQQHSLYTQSLC